MRAIPLAETGDPQGQNKRAKYPLVLLAIFALWWIVLAISPSFRQDWLLENLLVFVAVPLLVWNYRRLRFSNAAYTLMFLFFCLHEVGAHYTYAEVPYEAWFSALTGKSFHTTFGIQRNHFDRLVHFSYGLLIMPAVIELLAARGGLVGLWRNLVPVFFIMANSEFFEAVEWQAAEIFGGPLGQAYLGSQGDIWDAQKDSAMAAIGAIISVVIYRMFEARKTQLTRSPNTL